MTTLVTFSRKVSSWLVLKHGSVIAKIRYVTVDEEGARGNISLEHPGGRIDRYHCVVDEQSDARKL